jgi:hypothetical protein
MLPATPLQYQSFACPRPKRLIPQREPDHSGPALSQIQTLNHRPSNGAGPQVNVPALAYVSSKTLRSIHRTSPAPKRALTQTSTTLGSPPPKNQHCDRGPGNMMTQRAKSPGWRMFRHWERQWTGHLGLFCPFHVPSVIHSMLLAPAVCQRGQPIWAWLQDRIGRWARNGRSPGPSWVDRWVGKSRPGVLPSEVLSSGLHWQYRREKCVRTRSRSCVSPISGKAFRKVLKGNSRLLRASQRCSG